MKQTTEESVTDLFFLTKVKEKTCASCQPGNPVIRPQIDQRGGRDAVGRGAGHVPASVALRQEGPRGRRNNVATGTQFNRESLT